MEQAALNLDNLRGWMQGQDVVVVGCGPSAMYELRVFAEHLPPRWTIACNRAVEQVANYGHLDFAVCMETRKDPCWDVVIAAAPLITFTHISNPPPRCVSIHSDVSHWVGGAPKKLRLPMSPFYGAAVAIVLGFTNIGLIGVDMDGERFADDKFQHEWEDAWAALAVVAREHGACLSNLNPKSKLKAVPAGTWEGIRCKQPS